MCTLCILIPVLVGLICALLGYLLGRLLEKNSEVYIKLRSDLEACRREKERLLSLNNSLNIEVDSWRNKFNTLQSDFDTYKSKSISSVQPRIEFDAEKAASVFKKKIIENDLKIVEGIGPVIEELFHKAGINTWKTLAETPVLKCQQILDEGGEKFRIHNPGTWPKQSEMAYLGKWNELKEWQDYMSGGKE